MGKQAQLEHERPHGWGKYAERKEEFEALVKEWQEETEDSSIVALRYRHPAFLRILALGPVVIPWILAELKTNPDWWFEALKALTGEDPTKPTDSFDAAVEAWLAWGRANHFNV